MAISHFCHIIRVFGGSLCHIFQSVWEHTIFTIHFVEEEILFNANKYAWLFGERSVKMWEQIELWRQFRTVACGCHVPDLIYTHVKAEKEPGRRLFENPSPQHFQRQIRNRWKKQFILFGKSDSLLGDLGQQTSGSGSAHISWLTLRLEYTVKDGSRKYVCVCVKRERQTGRQRQTHTDSNRETDRHTHTYTHTHACIHILSHTHTYRHTHMHTLMGTHSQAYTNIHLQAHTFPRGSELYLTWSALLSVGAFFFPPGNSVQNVVFSCLCPL